ncbi:hypothetical protein RDI58_016925 [Solanum bulbocastanum]|uniref:Uncharacterized protein n=1 Tax=Solanum bulbocastanum TaxID=147425 RepID=A0AAN8TJU8_SOLBU
MYVIYGFKFGTSLYTGYQWTLGAKLEVHWEFGIWLKAENHVLFSEKRRQQGINSINESPVASGRRVEGTVNSLQHLEKGAEVAHTQGQNEPKGKEITSLSRKDNDVLNREDLSQMQPMEVTNYGSHEKEFGGGRDNAGEENYVGITTISKQGFNMASKKNDMSSQTLINENMFDGTTRGKDDITQINSKEDQDNIHQVLTAPEKMDVNTKTTTEQEDNDQVCTTDLMIYSSKDSSPVLSYEPITEQNNLSKKMKDNNNEGRKTRNWKRMARQVGCSVSLKNDISNATLDEGSVLAESPNGFPLHNEGNGMELSRPGGGGGGSLTVPFLKETMQLPSPHIIFLSKTKNKDIIVK